MKICTQCGQELSERACGPTHALLAAREILGVCPWCDTPVRADGSGGMEPTQEAIVHDEKFWWHQGCLADLARAGWERVNV